MNVAAVILAAGYGTRMKSKHPKVLHPLAGRPLVEWAVSSAEAAGQRPPVVVVGHAKDAVMAALGDRVEYAVQEEMLGTGHAVMQATSLLKGQTDAVLVLYADMPLIQADTLQNLIDLYTQNAEDGQTAIAMLTIERDDPQGFGRVIRDDTGAIQAVVEEADCTPEQLALRELNPGVYCFRADWLWTHLPHLKKSAKGEYYLTDMVQMATEQGYRVVGAPAPAEDVYGVNDRVHLAIASRVLRRRINEAHMRQGVTIEDPEATYIDAGVTIGQDTVILPGSRLLGNTRIGADCVIGPHSQIEDCVIGDNCRVVYSVLEQARMEYDSEIGPFSHLRKGAHLAEHVHMGNFGEVKNSYLGPEVKMGHFSYVGDATVGRNVNISAGVITCNYDGVRKNPTRLDDHVFLGSGSMLVAPVHLGEGARTGAGSVVTHDVSPHTLVYGVPARPAPAKPPPSRPEEGHDVN